MCDQNGFNTKLNLIESIPNPLEAQRAGGPLEGQKKISQYMYYRVSSIF